MHPKRLACLLPLVITFATLPARGELAIGGFGSDAIPSHPIRVFAAGAQGSDAPMRELAGPATQLVSPIFGVYEPHEQVIYVSDFHGQALRVYPAFANGDVAPLRVLNPPILGQTRANAPVHAHGEIGLIAYNCCIYTWPLHASGDAAPRLRGIVWGGGNDPTTQLNNPTSLIYIAATDEYAVSDYAPGQPSASRIVFHARTADGYAAPTRMLTGAGVAYSRAIAWDGETRRLFVLRQSPEVNGVQPGLIAVFADDASGEAMPLYTIEGPATLLDQPSGHFYYGIAHDRWLHRLWVSIASNANNPADNRVLGFDDQASGNATPLQQLSGSQLSGNVLGAPFAVPAMASDTIFDDGFEGSNRAGE